MRGINCSFSGCYLECYYNLWINERAVTMNTVFNSSVMIFNSASARIYSFITYTVFVSIISTSTTPDSINRKMAQTCIVSVVLSLGEARVGRARKTKA